MENEKEQGQRPKKGDDKREILPPDEQVREPQRAPAKPEGPGETGEPELPSKDDDGDEIAEDEDEDENDENV